MPWIPFPKSPPPCPACASLVTYHAPRVLCPTCGRWAHRGCADSRAWRRPAACHACRPSERADGDDNPGSSHCSADEL